MSTQQETRTMFHWRGAAAALSALDLDQPVDDLAALHQKTVHGKIDAVHLAAQFAQRVGRGF